MLSLKGKQISGRTRTLGLALGAAVLGVTLAGAVATPAQAYGWHGGWHHGWDHGWYGPRVGLGFGVYPPAYYYPARASIIRRPITRRSLIIPRRHIIRPMAV